MVEVPLKLYVQDLLKHAQEAVRPMINLPPDRKSVAFECMLEAIDHHKDEVFQANEKDLGKVSKDLGQQAYREAMDRIKLTEDHLKSMEEFIHLVSAYPDPIGEVSKSWMTPDGMQVFTVRSPLGVLAVITDMAPLSLVEAFCMCLKTNNVCVYRGGPEWFETQKALAGFLQGAVQKAGVPGGSLIFLEKESPEAAREVIKCPQFVQGVIARGRSGLRKGIQEQARMPVIGYDGGLCHMYIDKNVDIPLAQTLAVNAKVQSPKAATSLDTLLVHQDACRQLLPGLTRRLLQEYRVKINGCPKTIPMLGVMEMTGHLGITPAQATDWDKKFQGMTMNLKIVKNYQEAMDHIANYAPGHTDTIVTRDYALAMRFVREVDSSAVLVNASNRLHGGDSFGLGPEFGSNSNRLHGRGAITLSHLTTEKYMVLGAGQLKHPHPIPLPYEDAMMMSSTF